MVSLKHVDDRRRITMGYGYGSIWAEVPSPVATRRSRWLWAFATPQVRGIQCNQLTSFREASDGLERDMARYGAMDQQWWRPRNFIFRRVHIHRSQPIWGPPVQAKLTHTHLKPWLTDWWHQHRNSVPELPMFHQQPNPYNFHDFHGC